MNKSKELANTTDLVKQILESFPQARNSDMVLYVKVCEKMNAEAINKPFWYVLVNLKEFNLPNIETVRRTRQKIQADNPYLAGDANVEAQRMLNEETFREYAKGVM